MNWIGFLGYAAAASVLLTFCMGTMLPLRIAAITSNVLFATYGVFAHIYPVLVLHTILLPVLTLLAFGRDGAFGTARICAKAA